MELRQLRANGLTFQAWVGGSGPRLALLLHGFPDDPGSWFPLAERLLARGWTVAAPYLRGYGRSARGPGGDYQLASLARDVAGMVESLARPRALLVGHDWGAAIGYAAANLTPHRFSHLVALSVPPPRTLLRNLRRHPGQLQRSWYMGLFQLPLLAEAALRRRNYALIDRLWRDWSPGFTPPAERLAEIKRTFDYPGTVAAALGYYRALLPGPDLRRLPGASESWRLATRPLRVPGLVLTGARDGCIDPGLFQGAETAFLAPARLEVVPGAGHWLPLEATDLLEQRILELTGPDPESPAARRPAKRLPVVGA